MRSSFFVTAIIAGLTCLTPTNTVGQCTCYPYLTLRQPFQRADVVFIGRIIEAREILAANSHVTLVKVQVLETWKHDLEKFVTIKYEHDPHFSASFEPDFKSLLYAYKNDDGTFSAWNCCLATKPLAHAAEDLKLFKKWGEKPKRVIEPPAPPNKSLDRSGGSVFRIKPYAARSVRSGAASRTSVPGSYNSII